MAPHPGRAGRYGCPCLPTLSRTAGEGDRRLASLATVEVTAGVSRPALRTQHSALSTQHLALCRDPHLLPRARTDLRDAPRLAGARAGRYAPAPGLADGAYRALHRALPGGGAGVDAGPG